MKYLVSVRSFAFALATVVLFSSCGGGGAPATDAPGVEPDAQRQAKPVSTEPERVDAKIPADRPATRWGSVVGRVTIPGEAPARGVVEVNKDVDVCGKGDNGARELLVGGDRGVANAVVFLTGVTGGRTLAVPTQNPVIDQLGCRYEPHVLLVPAGATVDFKNSDGILHNLHTYSHINTPFNAAQPKFKKVISKELDHAEIISLTCDVHGWMRGWVVVHDHPYYALTGADGAFRLDGVPPGTYAIEVWHETLGTYVGEVDVAPATPTQHDVSMNLPG